MTTTFTRRGFMATTSGLLVLTPQLLAAQDTLEIQMLNKHPEDSKQRMVFYPLIQVVQPGSTVLFKSVDKGHNSETIKDMIPEGAEAWKSKISKDLEVTLDVPGFYGYKCTPHQSQGMVGLIVVEGEGKMDNLETARGVKHRGKAKGIWEDIWAQAEADGLLQATA